MGDTVTLSREVLKLLERDHVALRLYLHIAQEADHPLKFRGGPEAPTMLKPGQMGFNCRTWAKETGIPEGAIRKALGKLTGTGIIRREQFTWGGLIEIEAEYQGGAA